MSSSVCVYIILESPPKTFYDEIAASLQERRCPKRITKQRRYLGMTLASWGTVTRIRILLNPHASFSFQIRPVPGCDIVGSTELRKREHEKKNRRNSLFYRPALLFARLWPRLSHLRLPHSFAPSPLSESLERAIPDTVSVHTYPVNPAYESATSWIRSPEWNFF